MKGRTNSTSSWFSKENILRVLKRETYSGCYDNHKKTFQSYERRHVLKNGMVSKRKDSRDSKEDQNITFSRFPWFSKKLSRVLKSENVLRIFMDFNR